MAAQDLPSKAALIRRTGHAKNLVDIAFCTLKTVDEKKFLYISVFRGVDRKIFFDPRHRRENIRPRMGQSTDLLFSGQADARPASSSTGPHGV